MPPAHLNLQCATVYCNLHALPLLALLTYRLALLTCRHEASRHSQHLLGSETSKMDALNRAGNVPSGQKSSGPLPATGECQLVLAASDQELS